MAYFEPPMKDGRVRAHVSVLGKRDSEILGTLTKAKTWAKTREVELKKEVELEKDRTKLVDQSFKVADLFDKYNLKVSKFKKGADWESNKLEFYKREFPIFCSLRLSELEHEHFEDLADMRFAPGESSPLSPVKSSTFNRDLNLFSHCLTKARTWRLMRHNPLENYERLKDPEHRKRLVADHEREEMLEALNYREGEQPKEQRQYVALAWLIALETAMRRGEILSLSKATVDLDRGIAHLPDTKNGYARDVPLTPEARRLIKLLPERKRASDKLIPVPAESVSSTFRKARLTTDIKDMVFHDSRHQAITNFIDQKKWSFGEVMVMSGHKDIKKLQVYYNKTAEQIAAEMVADAKISERNPIAPLAGIKDLTQVDGLQDLIKMVVEQTKAA